MQSSDQSLLKHYLAGDDRAFSSLAERHVSLVFGVALRSTMDRAMAEEVVQDVFLLLAEKARRLANHSCLAGWLHTTARNLSRDARKKHRKHKGKLQSYAEQTSQRDKGLHESDTQREELDRAVQKLRLNEREVILLRFFEDLDYREIAQRLEISETTARKRVSRGIAKLHSKLKAELNTGAAMAVLAPPQLMNSLTLPVESMQPPASFISLLIMKKTTTGAIALTMIGIAGLSYMALEQSTENKTLLNSQSSLNHTRSREQSVDKNTSEQSKIHELKKELERERALRRQAQEDASFVRNATAGLDDQVIIAYGKVEDLGRSYGEAFIEALALSEIEHAGELDSVENKIRLAMFMKEINTLAGTVSQMWELENHPLEGGQFFAASYQAIFDLDASTTQKIEAALSQNMRIAKEKKLAMKNHPGMKMLSNEDLESFSEDEIEKIEAESNSWMGERQSFYREVRAQLYALMPEDKKALFEKNVEVDGIGFNAFKINGQPIGFSFGGKYVTNQP